MSILTLNCGSSSVKYSVYDTEKNVFVCHGIVERIGLSGSFLKYSYKNKKTHIKHKCPNHTEAVNLVLDVLTKGVEAPIQDISRIRGVGHRVVHGGEKFATSALITDEMMRTVESLNILAPLHNPHNLAGIRAARKLLPDIAHVAVFDTAFHQTLSPEAYIYPLPYEWYEKYGVRRYGFHGTSHLYVARRAAKLMKKPFDELRIITLHIGNGVSSAAISGGKSVDTSMGFTPLEGLVMGTRCGSIDPALPFYIMNIGGFSTQDMENILNKKSGLLGLCGLSDQRDIEREALKGDARAKLAICIETRTLRKNIGSYAAVMGGVDCIVFTAGVGENGPIIREKALYGLEFLGIDLDQKRNEKTHGGVKEVLISTDTSSVKVWVIPTCEELVIAEDTKNILQGKSDFKYSFG